MSYYHNDEQNNTQNEDYNEHFSSSPLQERLRKEEEEMKKRAQKAKGGSKVGYFISSLAGIIIGALLMWLLLPSLADQLPNNINTASGGSSNTATKVTQTATEVRTDIIKAVEQVSDAVVGISNIQDTAFNFWMQDETTEQTAGSGSGVVYKKEKGKAYIVTNYHVIDNAKRIEVTLSDGSKEQAKLVGGDQLTDLAVITIKDDKIKTVAKFGDSDVLKKGETVIAIGNPLGLDFYGSVTTGVISGKDRSVPVDINGDNYADWETDVLQTDAAINPGNSGGALVNIAGELVGINSMKIAQTETEGLGFAIPINSVIPIIEELEQKGEVIRPQLGVNLEDLTDIPAMYQEQLKLPKEVTTGVLVREVVNGSPADKGGVKPFDVIVEMDGQKIEDIIDLRKYLYNEKDIGDKLKLKVYREGKMKELELTLTDKNTF